MLDAGLAQTAEAREEALARLAGQAEDQIARDRQSGSDKRFERGPGPRGIVASPDSRKFDIGQ